MGSLYADDIYALGIKIDTEWPDIFRHSLDTFMDKLFLY